MPGPRAGSAAAARLAWGFLAAWILAQIAYPLTSGTARDGVTLAVVALGATTALAHACASYGLIRGVAGAAAVMTLGWAAEAVGLATGIPFGAYDYSPGRLGPTLLGVPLVVAAAWFLGSYPIWALAARLPAAWRIPAAAATLVGWDLYLDPQMIADGRWTWRDPSPHLPGLDAVPVSNFAGWFVVGLIVFGVLAALWPGTPADRTLPTVAYLWTWLGSALAFGVFLDDPLLTAALGYGLAAMAPLGIAAIIDMSAGRRLRRAGSLAR